MSIYFFNKPYSTTVLRKLLLPASHKSAKLAITKVPNAFWVQKLKASVCRKVCFRFYFPNHNILTYY